MIYSKLAMIMLFVCLNSCLQSQVLQVSAQAKYNELTLKNASTGELSQATCDASPRNSLLKRTSDVSDRSEISSMTGNSCSLQNAELDEDFKYIWIWKYIDEYIPGSKIYKPESSLDERMSNRNYLLSVLASIFDDVSTINTGNQEDDRRIEKLAAGNNFDQHKCEQQLQSMVLKLNELERVVENKRLYRGNDTNKLEESHIRLASVLDSFGHYDSGVLEGRNMMLGSYTQCLQSQLILDGESPGARTNTRYCFAKLNVDNHLDSDLKQRKMKSYEPEHALSVAICIPDSCHSASFTPETKHLFQTLVDSQFKMPSSLYVDERLEVKSIRCEIDKSSELRRLPWHAKLLVAFLISWIGLVIYASYKSSLNREGEKDSRASHRKTATDISKSMIGANSEQNSAQTSNHEKKITKIETVFDLINLQKSWKTFTSLRPCKENERVKLDTLGFIKVVCCALVVFGHTYLIYVGSRGIGFLNLLYSQDNEPSRAFFPSLTIIVDTFFVLSGILVSYPVLKKFSSPHKKQASPISLFIKQWFGLAVTRYLRLVPIFFLVTLFKKSLFIHLGSGPAWDYGVNKETYTGHCFMENSWFTPFSLTANYSNLRQYCVGQAWSISNDIFYAITLSPIIILMAKKPVHATVLSIIISVASSYSMYLDFSNVPASLSSLTREFRVAGFLLRSRLSDAWYMAPHNRMSPFLIGVIFGFLIYNYNQSKERREWPAWLRGTATQLSIIIIVLNFTVLPVIAHYRNSFFKYYPIHLYLSSHVLTSGRLTFALANSIIFLRMATDCKDKFLMKFCSSPLWIIMDKLNYSVLLVHLDVILFKLLSEISLTEFSNIEFIYEFAGVYLISFVLALFIHIFFESPINKLIRAYILERLFAREKVETIPNEKHMDRLWFIK